MGLRCTVFGHKWGDADTEREREEDGNEVVTTVREVRSCRRCGAEEVLATSKEVTALRSESASGGATNRHEGAAPTRDGEPGDGEESYDPETDDGVILDEDGDGEAERVSREWPNHPDRDDEDEAGETTPWPETARESDDEPGEERFVGADRQSDDRQSDDSDSGQSEGRGDRSPTDAGGHLAESSDGPDTTSGGGEIIEAGGGAPGDGSDDAPASGTEGTGLDDGDDSRPGSGDEPEEAEDPADGGSGESASGEAGTPARDEGSAPDVHVDEARGADDAGPVAGDEPGESADAETMMGPDATQRPDDDAEVLEATEPNEQSRATAQDPVDPIDHPPEREPSPEAGSPPESGPSLDPSEPPSDDEPAPEDVEFYCTECDYVDDSRWPSRRAGDVCPNCRRSYLSERRA